MSPHSGSFDLALARTTEQAALAAWQWFGRGDKNAADLAAATAIRSRFASIDCKGVVRIGEGLKDDAPGIFTGDRIGSWRIGAVPAAIAIDPIDGTTLTAKGLPGAISVLAAAICDHPNDDPVNLFPSIPSHYMQKIAVGPAVASSGRQFDLEAPAEVTLPAIAAALEKRVVDLVAVVLDRPRHQHLISSLRKLGCGIRLISDGDVAAAIAPSLPDSGVDLYVGIGGSPEAVISAAAIKGLGGEQLCRIWTKSDEDRAELQGDGDCTCDDLQKIWTVNEMARGDHIIFAASGISDSPMLRGIRVGSQHFVTHSMLVNSRARSMQFVETYYSFERKSLLPELCVQPDSSCGLISLA